MATRPNILLIHTDEHVFDFLGCMGHPDLKTPHIDALAARGFLFTNAYACNGVCVPSRASLLTGRYPIGHGVTCNEHTLHPAEPIMGPLLAAGGYTTGYFGKTHYGRGDDQVRAEWQEAFVWQRDYNAYLKANGVPVKYPEKRDIKDERIRYWNIGTSRIPLEHYFEKVIADKAIDFIERHAADEAPFICFVGNVAPHGPFSAPRPYDRLYDPASLQLCPRFATELENKPPDFVRWVEQNRKYIDDNEMRLYLQSIYGLISLVDDQVGRLMATLDTLGLRERTLVVFTADHGDFSSKYGIIGKSWCMDDRLLKVPLVIVPPGGCESVVTPALTENVDLLPTLLDYADAPRPERLHGASLRPLLEGRTDRHKECVFASNEFHTSQYHLRQSMVRRGDWKLVQSDTFKGELYHLADDPHEVRNRIDEPELRELVTGLRELLLRWHVGYQGGFYDPGRAGYWEDRTHFYDESRFDGG